MEKQVRIIKIITAVVIAIAFVCIIIFTCQMLKISKYKETTKELNSRKTELIQVINDYDSSNSYYSSNRSDYLEDYAREVLGWGEAGEIWYTNK